MASSLETAIPLRILPPSQCRVPDDIILCKNVCEDAFVFALDNAPYALCETGDEISAHTMNPAFVPVAQSDALFLLSTPTCYHAPVAQWLSQAIVRHYRFTQSLAMGIHTSLHEAIANAVIHGNLGIHGRFQNTEGFDAYYAHIHARLNHPEHNFKRISVAVTRNPGNITLCVSDEGDGYRDGTDYESSGNFPPGQGLSVIREHCSAVRVACGGSMIEMEFAV